MQIMLFLLKLWPNTVQWIVRILSMQADVTALYKRFIYTIILRPSNITHRTLRRPSLNSRRLERRLWTTWHPHIERVIVIWIPIAFIRHIGTEWTLNGGVRREAIRHELHVVNRQAWVGAEAAKMIFITAMSRCPRWLPQSTLYPLEYRERWLGVFTQFAYVTSEHLSLYSLMLLSREILKLR